MNKNDACVAVKEEQPDILWTVSSTVAVLNSCHAICDEINGCDPVADEKSTARREDSRLGKIEELTTEALDSSRALADRLRRILRRLDNGTQQDR